MDTIKLDILKTELQKFRNSENISNLVYKKASSLFINGQCQMLTQSKNLFDFLVEDEFDDYIVRLKIDETEINAGCNCKSDELCHHKIASIMQLYEELSRRNDKPKTEGKKYTRQGMILRVMDERQEKAKKAEYKIEQADNIYGEHVLYNEKGKTYKITFHNFEKEQGYCSCPDYSTNKLGTCKHLMFAFNNFKQNNRTPVNYKHEYPFIEIYLDPLNDYKISWFFNGGLESPVKQLIEQYFGNDKVLSDEKVLDFLGFIQQAQDYKQIFIRPGVQELIEKGFNEEMLEEIRKSTTIDYSFLKEALFPYQKEGVEFAVFREGAIIADEMGLGKTIQAIATAIAKKTIFGFKRTLIICPASIKQQWKQEIEKFSFEKAIIIEGTPDERAKLYKNANEYFLIINYETVLRDSHEINKYSPDFIILDEAQRIKNYSTLTSKSIKSLKKRHSLIITGTPIENRLIDIYSITGFLDQGFLTPLWEFSYQHCLFDIKQKNKITGYYNLQSLKAKLSSILIRREKKEVIKQLPNISHLDIPVQMHPEQRNYHASYSKGVARILAKKFITPFDMQKLMLLLAKMRMVCDSTYLIDFETNYSPKLIELQYILFEKLDIVQNNKKIIIFSEWKRMNNIIAKMLRDNDIGFVELNGSIPVKKRGNLIREFEQNENCLVFLSTESGGTGLNLQVADTVINFELPWNPAKKNQRIGRIDRIGQKSQNLTVVSFITRDSIEEKIAGGLLLKQNLFDSVLNMDNTNEVVDFSEKGRSQFLQQLQNAIVEFEKEEISETDEKDEGEVIEETGEEILFDKTEDRNLENKTIEGKETIEIESKIESDTSATLVESDISETIPVKQETIIKENNEKAAIEIEQVMNQGMGFLSGLFKMATGKDMGTGEQSINVNKETGEVTMKFKLPI